MASQTSFSASSDDSVRPARSHGQLAAVPAKRWRAAASRALAVLVGAALLAAPVVVWALWLRGR